CLVPKLRLGTCSEETPFPEWSGTRETEFPGTAFPNGVWERGQGLDHVCFHFPDPGRPLLRPGPARAPAGRRPGPPGQLRAARGRPPGQVRLQRGVVPRLLPGPRRVAPVALRPRPGHGLPGPDPRRPGPARGPGRPGPEPGAAQGDRPGLP